MSNDDKNEESFISHLEALRAALLKCVYSLAIAVPVTFLFAPKILNSLIKIFIGNSGISLNYFSPVEVFMLQIKISILVAFLICLPYIMKQLWDFILPALYDNEKKFLKTLVLISSGLFFSGVLFALFVIMPLIMNFGMQFSTDTVRAMFNISGIINLLLWLCIAFGLMFQVPVITYYLIKSDIISYSSIADKRPYVIVIILILSAVLTPPDIISQLLLGTPTYLLFEAGLLLAKLKKKKNLTDSDS
ncbi:twin-arginine translocase subunit TatC [bacterium]|nr:twin-arginine translocase subunit TatC [bacterium]